MGFRYTICKASHAMFKEDYRLSTACELSDKERTKAYTCTGDSSMK